MWSSHCLCVFPHLPLFQFNKAVYLNVRLESTFSMWAISLFKKLYVYYHLNSPFNPFDGDTVCMTLFVVPILAPSFAILALSHSPTSGCPRLPTEQTLTVSHFLCQKAGSVPLGLMSLISQPVFPLSCTMSQCTCPTSASQATGNNGGERQFVIKTEVVWWCWQTTGDAGCPHVHLQRDGLRTDWMMGII